MSSATLVLKGGTVIDGTGKRRFAADVAVQGNRIAAIDPKASLHGDQEIDCNGLIVTPGFIDTHSHSDLRVLEEPELSMKVRQGVTLDVFGQDGISVAPIRPAVRAQMERVLAGLLGELKRPWDWQSVAEYLEAIERAQPALDCAYLVPHGAVRLLVMGMEDRRATPDETAEMQALLRQAMHEGAVGLSTGLIYPPCFFADTGELTELCRTVTEFDGVFVTHIRSESDYIEQALAEMILVAKHSGVRLHLSHFKAAGRENWGKVDSLIQMVREAQEQGVRVTADQYPYVAGSTMLGAILPPWAHAGGVEETLARLRSDGQRARMRAEILDRRPSTWDNFWKWSGPEGIVIPDVSSGRHPEYVGKTLAQAARIYHRAVDEVNEEAAVEFVLDLLAEERLGVGMISFSQSEDVVQKIMREPYVNICTDGLLGGLPHPRAYGTYPRILGRYVRELGLLTLDQAIRKMSGLAAESLNLQGYGRIAVGWRANLVAFNAERVLDRATFENPKQYPVGIEHVIVEGLPVVQKGAQCDVRSGVAVRSVHAATQ